MRSTAEPTWHDKYGTVGSQWSSVRLLHGVTGLASIRAGEEERVVIPAGASATVLGVDEASRLLTVEFGRDVEGNVFANVGWDQVEIVPLDPPI
jgi:hypothetical protein